MENGDFPIENGDLAIDSHWLLLGGLEHGFYFPFHIWDVILPIDELIFFRGGETTNQSKIVDAKQLWFLKS